MRRRKLKEKTIHVDDDPDFQIDCHIVFYQNQGNGNAYAGDVLIKPGESWEDYVDTTVILEEVTPIVLEGTTKKLLVKEYMIY